MSARVSVDLLLRVAQATPEQIEAIERFLRGEGKSLQEETEGTEEGPTEDGTERLLDAVLRVDRKVEAVRSAVMGRHEPTCAEGCGTVNESEARRVFALMKQLEGGPRQWKAPLATVFRLTVLEGHSQGKTARLCDCVPGLISRRVKTLEARFGMAIERLRNFASAILEMEASVRGDRYRKRKRGAPADESAQYDDDPGQAELVEDDEGYLPEERADYGA